VAIGRETERGARASHGAGEETGRRPHSAQQLIRLIKSSSRADGYGHKKKGRAGAHHRAKKQAWFQDLRTTGVKLQDLRRESKGECGGAKPPSLRKTRKTLLVEIESTPAAKEKKEREKRWE